MMIAALYVEADGVYAGLPGVDLWDQARDARTYAGPHPVVAHPPCQRWCRLAPVNLARYGQAIGDDAGCFTAALASVRRWGGVLEHPAYSRAWLAHHIPWPGEAGGWQRDADGGWCCYVEQISYGHQARKPTWLYAVGVDLPELRWGRGSDPAAWIGTSQARNRALLGARGIAQLGGRAASETPLEFRDLLISIAATAQRQAVAA
jgi:hypothetical protein